MTTRDNCPTKEMFAKALSGEDSTAVRAHLDRCPRCRELFERQRRVVVQAKEIPGVVRSPEQVAKAHDALLERAAMPATKRGLFRDWRVWALAAMVPLLLGAVILFAIRYPGRPPSLRDAPGTTAPVYRASIHAATGADYRRVSGQPDEIVRLFSGTLTFSVDALHAGERFRVITGDAAVEVKGTMFEVKAVGDRLTTVRVLSGVVEVTPSGRAPSFLASDESWRAADAASPETPAPSSVTEPTPDEAAAAQHPFRGSAMKRLRSGPGAEQHRNGASKVEAAFNRGWTELREGDFAAAVAAFEEVLTAKEKTALKEDAAYWLAVAHQRAGHTALAEKTMVRFLSEYPRGERAADLSVKLGWIDMKNGRFESAARRFVFARDTGGSETRESAEAGLETLKEKRKE